MKGSCSVGRLLIACAAGLAAGAASVHALVAAEPLLWGALGLFILGLGISLHRTHNQHLELESIKNQAISLESSYARLVENLPIGLFIRSEGRFVSTNWAWDEQLMREPGIPAEQAFARVVPAEELPLVQWQINEGEAREEPIRIEYRVNDSATGERFLEWRSVPVYKSDGELEHFIGFNLDVTEAKQAALALQDKNRILTETYEQLEANLEAMVRSLVKAIEAKDPYTAGHTERVMRYALKLADEIGLAEADRITLRMGTLLHDIGKIGIPDHILTKPSGLTNEEYEVIKRHPVIGANVIQDIPHFKDCVPIVRWHHEQLNGRGYPDGLSGDEIPLLVRIATIADMYDAMTSTRAYRHAMTAQQALDELRKDVMRGRTDPDLVATWEVILRREGLLGGSAQRAA